MRAAACLRTTLPRTDDTRFLSIARSRYGTFRAKVERGGGDAQTNASSSSVANDKQEPTLGVWGAGGIMSVPKVKTLLFLVCVVQVRHNIINSRVSASPCAAAEQGTFEKGKYAAAASRNCRRLWPTTSSAVTLRGVGCGPYAERWVPL